MNYLEPWGEGGVGERMSQGDLSSMSLSFTEF